MLTKPIAKPSPFMSLLTNYSLNIILKIFINYNQYRKRLTPSRISKILNQETLISGKKNFVVVSSCSSLQRGLYVTETFKWREFGDLWDNCRCFLRYFLRVSFSCSFVAFTLPLADFLRCCLRT